MYKPEGGDAGNIAHTSRGACSKYIAYIPSDKPAEKEGRSSSTSRDTCRMASKVNTSPAGKASAAR